MNEELKRGYRAVEELEKFIGECKIILYSEVHKRLLRRIIELWDRGVDVTLYVLEKKDPIGKSRYSIERSLKLLKSCGLIYVKETIKGKTNSPKGKKPYYPTPIAIILDAVLTLLYPEDLDDIEKGSYYYIVWDFVDETLYQILPSVYDYLFIKAKEDPKNIEYINLLKAYLITIHALNLLMLIGIKAGESIFSAALPKTSSKDLLEDVKKHLYGHVESLEKRKTELIEGSLGYKAVDILLSYYKLLAKSLGVHIQEESLTRFNS